MNAPSRNPSDFSVAPRAESALLIPEESEGFEYPGTCPACEHLLVSSKIGFIGGIVRVCFAFDLTCRLMGCYWRGGSHSLRGCPSSSHVSPKKDQSRP